MTNARRSIFSGLVILAAAAATVTSLLLFAPSSGVEGQTASESELRQGRGRAGILAPPANGLSDIHPVEAVRTCGREGGAACTEAELVVWSVRTGHIAGDELNEDGTSAKREFATANEVDLTYTSWLLGSTETRTGRTTRSLGFTRVDNVFASVVNQTLDEDDDVIVQNAILDDANVIGIGVYDPDASARSEVTIENDDVMDGTAINGGPGASSALLTAVAQGASVSLFINHAAEVDGTPVLPIVDANGNGSLLDEVTYTAVDAAGDRVTIPLATTVVTAGNPSLPAAQLSRGFGDGFISFSNRVAQTYNDVQVSWSTADVGSRVVVELTTNSTSSRRAYLELREQERGSGLFIGEVELISSGIEVNRTRYETQRSSTATTLTTAAGEVTTDMTSEYNAGPTVVVAAPPRTGSTRTQSTRVLGDARDGAARAIITAGAADQLTVSYIDKTGVSGNAPNQTDDTGAISRVVGIETTPPVVVISRPSPEAPFATSNQRFGLAGTASESGDRASGIDVDLLRLLVSNPIGANSMSVAEDLDAPLDLGSMINASGIFGYEFPGASFTMTSGENTVPAPVYVAVGSEDAGGGLYGANTNYADGRRSVTWGFTPSNETRYGSQISTPAQLNHVITYQVIAIDVAGNVGFSDSTLGNDVGDDGNIRNDVENFTLTLDGAAPELVKTAPATFDFGSGSDVSFVSNSRTGLAWDAGEADVVVARNSLAVVFTDRIVNPRATNFSVDWDGTFNSSIAEVVQPPRANDIEVSTLDADSPSVCAGGGTSCEGLRLSEENRSELARILARTVFLVFDQDIPSEQTPEVTVTGVEDLATNDINTTDDANQVDVGDGLGPSLEVSLSNGTGEGTGDNLASRGPQVLTANSIDINIDVNEAVERVRLQFVFANPTVGLTDPALALDAALGNDAAGVARTNGQGGATNIRERTPERDVDARPDGPNRLIYNFRSRVGDGVRCVIFTATDVAGNVTTVGRAGDADTDCQDFDGSVFFVVDATDPGFDADVQQGEGGDPLVITDGRTPIQIALNEEVQADSVSLEVNGEEVDDLETTLRTANGRTFVYQPSPDNALPLGRHEFRVSATDYAGNEDTSLVFNVRRIERSPLNYSISNGWNLISFPSNPTAPAVSTVFNNPAITVVSTFDPADFRAGTVDATRNPVSGTFSGDLDSIKTGLAYWVFSDSFTQLEVTLEGETVASEGPPVPPEFATVQGYNLVGVVSTTRAQTSGSTGPTVVLENRSGVNVRVEDYFNNVTTSRILRYNSISRAFEPIATSDTLEIGMGILAYIVPANPANPVTPPITPP